MKCFVGTSGWSYAWNRGHSLKWYVENTPFNTVELNASFYRFPHKNYIIGWKKIGEKGLRFSIKVHRLITHVYRLKSKAFETWDRFKNLFLDLDEFVDFYLFQLPPSLGPDKMEDILKFIEYTRLGERFALEFRNKEWFNENVEKIFKNVTLVSVSTPELEHIFNTSGNVYMRFHGKNAWYRYTYSKEELLEYHRKVYEMGPFRAYFYFNNDIGMFENALTMAEICELK